MMHGTAPPPPRPPPPDHIPPDQDTEMTNEQTYTTIDNNEDELWIDPPDYAPPGLVDAERHARRTANHSAYRINGHPTIWKNYIYYGYYMYDDCHDFMKAWKATVYDRLERQRFVWREYHYRRLHNIPVSDTLQKRVNEKTIPYLKEHDPDLWLASDMEYEEVMFFNDSTTQSAPNMTNNEWHEVSPKRRSKKSTPPQSRDTSPHSPTRKTVQIATKPTGEEFDHTTTATSTKRNKEAIDVATTKTPPRGTKTQENQHTRNTPRTIDNMDKRESTIHPDSSTNIARHDRFSNATPVQLQEHGITTDDAQDSNVLPSGNSTNTGRVSTAKSINTHMSSTNPLNDGTFRLTIRWKPANYDEILANQTKWDATTTETLIEVFGDYADTINLIKWDDSTQSNITSLETTLTTGNIRRFLSPRITNLASSEQFIFGLRISMGDRSPSKWINDGRTKRILHDNNMNISISNSKTNSGDVVTAGHILLKHPDFTHRTYYLMSLRRHLPSTTPFFDIGLVYTTPQREEKIPHLIVKCGSNHVTALSEVLSTHLDGKQTTALYLATSLLNKMTTEEAYELFATHKKFTASIQRLPLFPQVINIDRPRTESTTTNTTLERSTREWATGLKLNESGMSLRCDAENGGKDRRAYLLVPTAYLEQAKHEFEQYKHRLKQSGQFRNHEQPDDRGHGKTDKPQEIYVPTAAVLRNLQFMQSMSSESIWRAAPPSVRHRSVTPSNFAKPGARPEKSSASASQELSDMEPNAKPHNKDKMQTEYQHGHQSHKAFAKGNNPRHQSTDEATTICTTQSLLTRNTPTQSTITALEDTIHRQQQEIKNMLLRFDEMDNKMEHLTTAIKSGETNHNQTILQIQQQLDTVCTSLSYLVQHTTLNQQPQAASCPTLAVERTTANQDMQIESQMAQRSDSSKPEHNLEDPVKIIQTNSSRSQTVKSPEKKKQRSNEQQHVDTLEEGNQLFNPCHPMILDAATENNTQNINTDQSGAQYNKSSPFDSANPD